MYNIYFGFSESPFEDNLDQRFLYFSANHREVTASLLYFIEWKKSFAIVCGDGGTGKTLLANYLLSRLPGNLQPILMAIPDVGDIEILRFVAGILKIDDLGKSESDLAYHIKSALLEAGRQNERFVLIVDAAHLLSEKSFEQIGLLSNVETQAHSPLQILLLGQHCLSSRLNRPELGQLSHRITINRFLAPLDGAETIHYIDFRLNVAGGSFDACFEPQCKSLIFKMTGGIPRSINHLCDSALRVCMSEKLLKVNKDVLKKAGADLRTGVFFTPGFRDGGRFFSLKKIRLPAVLGAVAVILVLLGFYGYQKGLKQPDPAIENPPEIAISISVPMPSGAVLPEVAQPLEPEAALPEVTQTLQPAALEPPIRKTGRVDISPLLRVKASPPAGAASRLHKAKSVGVKKEKR
jgi:general secretion pathway protein A